MPFGKRRAGRSRKAMKPYVRRPARRVMPQTKGVGREPSPYAGLGMQGGFFITRRTLPVNFRATGTGTVIVDDDTAGIVTIGTPLNAASGMAGLYDIPFGMEFKLDAVRAYQDIANIADKFRIRWVKLDFYSSPNAGYNASQGNVALPIKVDYFFDATSGTAPTVGYLENRMGTQTGTFSETGHFSTVIRPTPVMLVGDVGTSQAAVPALGTVYLSSATGAATPHFGLRACIRDFIAISSSSSTGPTSTMSIVVTYCVEARDLA